VQCPAEALQDRRPVLRRDELHGVHAQHAVELVVVGELLQVVLVGGDAGNFAAALAR
jgi:hypothetical protein